MRSKGLDEANQTSLKNINIGQLGEVPPDPSHHRQTSTPVVLESDRSRSVVTSKKELLDDYDKHFAYQQTLMDSRNLKQDSGLGDSSLKLENSTIFKELYKKEKKIPKAPAKSSSLSEKFDYLNDMTKIFRKPRYALDIGKLS